LFFNPCWKIFSRDILRAVRAARFDPAAESADASVADGVVPLETRRQLNIRRRKKRILDSATKLISSEGIEACTMRRLAAKARLDVTTLYNYYGSKEQILEALRRAGARSIRRQIEELTERDPIARIRAIVRVTLGVRESSHLSRPLNLIAHRRRPGEGPAAAAAKEALLLELERAIDGKLLEPSIDSELLTSAILEAFHPWLELWAAGAVDTAEIEARVDYNVSLCLLAGATKKARRRLESELIESQRRLRARSPLLPAPKSRLSGESRP
jgi:AcrR family transcriptional regulator